MNQCYVFVYITDTVTEHGVRPHSYVYMCVCVCVRSVATVDCRSFGNAGLLLKIESRHSEFKNCQQLHFGVCVLHQVPKGCPTHCDSNVSQYLRKSKYQNSKRKFAMRIGL